MASCKTVQVTVWDEDDVPLEVQALVWSAIREVKTRRNGDPGWPGEAAEVEVVSVMREGHEVTGALSDELVERIEMKVWEAVEDD